MQQWTPDSDWVAQGCDMDHLYKSHSVLPTTDQLLHYPPRPRSSLSVPVNSLHGGGFFRRKNISSPSALHLHRYRSHPTSSLLPFPYSFFHPTQIKPRQHIKKQRHYFAKKVHLVKAMVFPVLMYGFESWTINKAEVLKKLMLLNCGVGEDS